MSAIPQPAASSPQLVPPMISAPVGGSARSGEVFPLISAPSTLGRLLEIRDRGTFAIQPLPGTTLGLLLSAARWQPRDQQASWLGVSVVCLNVDHELDGMVAQFHPERHALIAVQPSPTWLELVKFLDAEDVDGAPAVVVVVWIDPERGPDEAPSGPRQALLQGGALLHALSLMVAELGLVGVQLDSTDESGELTLADLVQVPGAAWVAALAVGLPQ